MGKSSPSPPPPPDPVATATAQGVINADTARLQAQLNRLDQVTPYGSLTYEDLGNDRSRAITTLSDAQTRLLNLSNQAQETYGSAALNQLRSVQGQLSTPFSYSGPTVQSQIADRSLGVQSGLPDRSLEILRDVQNRTGDLQRGVMDRTGDLQRGVMDRSSELQRGVMDRTGDLQRGVLDRSSDLQRGVLDRTEQLQRGVDLGNRADFTGIGDPNQSRNAVESALMARMNPSLTSNRNALEARLINQGITPGSQAWETGMRDYNMQENDARYGAILNAGQEQSRLFGLGFGQTDFRNRAALDSGNFANAAIGQASGMDMARGQFANAATGQAMADAMARGQFANFATGQANEMDLARGQFANSATGQAMADAIARGQFANAATGQAMADAIARGQFANSATGQANEMDLTRGQFANSATGQAMADAIARGQFANSATSQAMADAIARGQFANSATGQTMADAIARGQFANSATGQASGMDLAQTQFRNQATDQLNQGDLQRFGFQNQTQQQLYGMDMGRAQFNNAAAQQSLQQQLALRGQPINEASALLSGQQIQAPQFANVPQTNVQAADYQGAVAQNYAAANAQYNAQLQRGGADTAAIAGLLGRGLGGLAFRYSDRRLKRDVKRIGTGFYGLPIYRYDYLWGEPAIGYMADEVAAVAPHAIMVGHDGFAQVNYGALK